LEYLGVALDSAPSVLAESSFLYGFCDWGRECSNFIDLPSDATCFALSLFGASLLFFMLLT
jgi:hypothetical protein